MDRFDRYVGKIFDRRYKIIKIIGVGGMAVVFEAVDMVMHRNVAVKMLKDEIANDTQAVRRFINESKAVSMLSHPNIVSIYDVSVRENIKYIVMELVDGITLKNYMNKKEVLSLRETLNIAEQVLRALEHAHSKGIIHRDIKPQNIMMLKNGRIKVTDFGIAKLPNAETVTMTDKAIGTVFYISPEQASGKPIDPRSDLYSLGVMLYEMTTGRLPFMADSPVSVALMQVNNTPVRPREINPSIPIGLEQIILAAMEKNPERRLQTAGQMLRYLEQIQSNPNFVFRAKRAGEITSSTITRSTHSTGNIPLNSKRRKNRSMLPIISGITAAFLVVLGISAGYALIKLLGQGNDNAPKSVKIPMLVGEVLTDDLYNELKAYNYYNIEIVPAFDESTEANTIINQEPSAGESRKVQAGKQYTDLKLYVSQGEQTYIMPDVTVMEYRAVRIELRDKYGLKVTVVPENHDTMMEGYVFRTEPEAGTVVTPGDEVTIYYSIGQAIKYTSVPDFYKMTEKEAMNTLVSAELSLGNVTYAYSGTVPAGRIISQSRLAYTEVPSQTTKIDFVVSLGAETLQLADYTNMTKEAAIQALEALSLRYEIVSDNSSTVEEGRVIRTSPSAGEEVNSATVITLYISLGMPDTSGTTTSETDRESDTSASMKTVQVPDLYFMQYNGAVKALHDIGLEIGEVSYESSMVPAGRICGQLTDAYSEVPVGSKVSIIVSLGND